jgi:hypothetical protein
MSAGPFIVVYPEGYEETGAYTLTLAGEMYNKLLDLWGRHIRLQGPVRILLTDVYDLSNGSATFFPFNQIEIYLFNPPPDSTLGSYEEWIRLVLSHELTHILHFNSGSGFTYFMRKILGSHPALFPIFYAPGWVMEGTAIVAESRLNRWGRLDTPDFSLLLNHIAGGDEFPDWGDIFGQPTPWPGATSSYLYGALFMDFLGKKYGTDKIPQLMRFFTRYPLPLRIAKKQGPIPLTLHQRFKQVFDKDINVLWDEFVKHLRGNPDLPKESAYRSPPSDSRQQTVKFLTSSGKYKKYPIALDNRHLVYIDENYKKYPGIYRLDLETGKTKRLVQKRGINGWSYAKQENKIYLSAVDYYKSFYLVSDIYSLDLNSNKIQRLTRGRRLSYPVKPSPAPAGKNSAAIYCVKRKKTRSFLCRLDTNTGKEEKLSRAFDGLAFLSISPDNRYIAASVKQRDENWRIGFFDMKGKLVRFLSDGLSRCYYPLWKSKDELLYIGEYKKSYRLTALDLRKNSLTYYRDSRVPPVNSFGIMPETGIVGAFLRANGYNLGVMDTSLIRQESISRQEFDTGTGEKTKEEASTAAKARKYRFIRDLLPKYIDFTFRNAGSEVQPGLFLNGRDLTEQHAFTLEGYWGFDSRTANVFFNYTYDGFYPSLSFSYSDLADYHINPGQVSFIHRERKFQLSELFPLRIKNRSQAYIYSDIHFETITDDVLETAERFRIRLNGMKLALFYNTARRYYDSFSDADGIRLSLSYAREFTFMGSDYNINTAALEYKQYISLLRPNVLALRFGITDSWGEAKRVMYMGGSEPQSNYHTAGNDLFDLMRGYPSGYFNGTGGYLLNLEYRISLWKIENVFFIFRSIERLYMTLFTDIGNLWQEEKVFDPSYSIGGELNLVTLLGDFRMTFSLGAAVGQNPYHKPVFYLRIGNSF